MTSDNNIEPLPLLTEHDVARITGLSLASVRRWRLIGQGPRFLKLGRAVRYRREDLSAWLKSRPGGGAPTGCPERPVLAHSPTSMRGPAPN